MLYLNQLRGMLSVVLYKCLWHTVCTVLINYPRVLSMTAFDPTIHSYIHLVCLLHITILHANMIQSPSLFCVCFALCLFLVDVGNQFSIFTHVQYLLIFSICSYSIFTHIQYLLIFQYLNIEVGSKVVILLISQSSQRGTKSS